MKLKKPARFKRATVILPRAKLPEKPDQKFVELAKRVRAEREESKPFAGELDELDPEARARVLAAREKRQKRAKRRTEGGT